MMIAMAAIVRNGSQVFRNPAVLQWKNETDA